MIRAKMNPDSKHKPHFVGGNPRMEAALGYAARGWTVLPLYTVRMGTMAGEVNCE